MASEKLLSCVGIVKPCWYGNGQPMCFVASRRVEKRVGFTE